MAINRVVRPELLDSLSPSDPAARRSRDDLVLINALMGNFRWLRQAVSRFPDAARQGIVEIGAGEGRLGRLLRESFPLAPVTGVDFVPRPQDLPASIAWQSGDLFRTPLSGGVLVGCMILHHFSAEKLGELGRSLAAFQVLCFCEPWRHASAHAIGTLMGPLFGPVTRHDLHVSVDAGFQKGELPGLLGLRGWRLRESVDVRGAIRLIAWKE